MSNLSFTSVKTGRKYMINQNDYWLRNCPCCKNRLHMNKYKDLIVNRVTNYSSDISISIAMEYCDHCYDLFIRSDY